MISLLRHSPHKLHLGILGTAAQKGVGGDGGVIGSIIMRGVAPEGQHNAAVVQKIFHNKGHVNARGGGVVSDFIAL